MKKYLSALILGLTALSAAHADALPLFYRLNPRILRSVIHIPTQQEQDVSTLLDTDFPSDAFGSVETEIQGRIQESLEGAKTAITRRGYSFGPADEIFKQYVVEILQQLILLERNDEAGFRDLTDKLGRMLSAFASDNGETAGDAMRNMREYADTWGAWEYVYNYELDGGPSGAVKKVGDYLKLQLAEAAKDMAKASRQARSEIHIQSTLAEGGSAFRLVYWCCGFDGGRNHINGLANADLWYEGNGNWLRVAEALKTAVRFR
jgi:hypothetical protein